MSDNGIGKDRANGLPEGVGAPHSAALGAEAPSAHDEQTSVKQGRAPSVLTEASGAPLAESAVPAADANEVAEWNRRVKRRMAMRTRRSFITGGAAALVAFGGWRWLTTRRYELGIPWPLRQGLNLNGELARDFFKPTRLAPDLRGKAPLVNRINGDIGLDDPVDFNAWRLSVAGLANHDDPVEIKLDAIKKLPRVEMTIEFKCIEGWSIVTEWAGARFSDFMAAYPPATMSGDPLDLVNDPEDLPPYVEMATPDGGYYVGLDMESMLHPQTLLAYEMNHAPLTQEHGAPLRLVTPVKYGVKNLKRIGTISYGVSRPADYWAEQGYDWYAGL
ncbi:MAG: molybdopterin-dependent oxidoreductase [Terriglobia bacterium]